MALDLFGVDEAITARAQGRRNRGGVLKLLAPLAPFSLLPIGERSAHAILRSVIALMIVATTAVAPQSEAAAGGDGQPSSISSGGRGAPLAVIDRTDIELSGARDVSDLLLGRLDYNSFGLHRPFVLGSGRVAVLVNGRRISDSAFDLDTLPISAVERIEILSDGAAALHGGYAIGGVVNIVLRRDHEGVGVHATAERPAEAGGDAEHLGVLWGSALGAGHITLGADILRRQEIRNADRDYSRASWEPGGSFADASGVSVGGNTVFISTGGGSVARSLGDCEGSAYTGLLTDPYGISGSGCGFAWAEIAWGTLRYERESLFLNLDHPLGEDADMYFDVRAAWGDTAFRYAPSVGTFSFAPSEALGEKLLEDPEIDTLPERLHVAHRFVSHGNRDWITDLGEYDFTLGIQRRLASGIGYDAHLRYYRHDALEVGDTFVSESAIQTAIDEGRYDLENPSSPAPEHLAAIRETGLQLNRDQATDHQTARVSLDGPAFALGGGDVRWVAGAEVAYQDWRDIYDYRDALNRSYDPGDVLGSGGHSASGQRRRWSAFTEVSLPFRGDWDLVLTGRRDDHDDVGEAFSHQVASRYRLHEAFALRGSWSEGSKAPSLYTLHVGDALDYPVVCDTKALTGSREDCDEYQVERASGGNPNLKPDEAQSFSFGAATSLAPLSLSADWFRIRLSDVPARLSAQSIVDLEAEGQLPPGAVVVRDGDLISRIESPWVNSGESDMAGFDFRARANWKTDWADLVLAPHWSLMTQNEDRVAGEIQPGDYPRHRVHTSLRASRSGFTANWSVHAVSSYWNTLETARYEAWTGHDITFRWRDAFGLSGMDLVGGVLNVGDSGPSTDPTNPGVLGADTTLDSVRGRTLFLTTKVLS